MRQHYLKICQILDKLTVVLCLLLLMALLGSVIVIVILRYSFGLGFIELQDFATYTFAMLVILGLPLGLVRDSHVRVDVLREHMTARTRELIDKLAIILLLLPVFGMLLYTAYPGIVNAWAIREGSVETGGLGGLYLVKTTIPIAAILLLLQGLARLLSRNGQ